MCSLSVFLTTPRLFYFSQPHARECFIKERYVVGIRVASGTDGVNDAVSVPTLQQFENPTSIPANSFIPGIDTKLSKHQTIHVKNCLRLSFARIEPMFLFHCLFRHPFSINHLRRHDIHRLILISIIMRCISNCQSRNKAASPGNADEITIARVSSSSHRIQPCIARHSQWSRSTRSARY